MPVPKTPDPPFLYSSDGQPSDFSRGSSSLRLTWNTSSDVRFYEIRFVNSSTGSIDARSNVSPTTFSGLQENTKYLIALRGVNADGASSWSNNFEVFTRPPIPTSLRLAGSDEQSRGFDSLQLAWSSVGVGYQYDLQFNQSTEIRNHASGDFISSLQADTVYSVEVRARDATNDNSSFWSNPPFMAITRPPTPDAIASPTLGAFSSTIVLEWELQSVAGSYIQLRQTTDEGENLLVQKGELKQNYTLQGYEYGKDRSFSIRLIIPRRQAPSGLNESFWSPGKLIPLSFPPGLFNMIEISKYNALEIFNKFPKIS